MLFLCHTFLPFVQCVSLYFCNAKIIIIFIRNKRDRFFVATSPRRQRVGNALCGRLPFVELVDSRWHL